MCARLYRKFAGELCLFFLWFWEKCFPRKFEFALFVDIEQFYAHNIPDIENPVHGFEPLPVDFRNVEQTVLARNDLNKRTEWHDRFHLSFVHLAYFRF